MNLIELHIIQSFPVTCLNRDDLGSPKNAIFGGVQRARVSSQCWKRAIREAAHEAKPEIFNSVRSRLVGPKAVEAAKSLGASENISNACGKIVCAILGKDDKADGMVKTLLYFSPKSIQNLVKGIIESGNLSDDVALSILNDTSKKCDVLSKFVKEKISANVLRNLGDSVDDAADIALFGRMVADDATQTVEGAAMFSHALSTHSVRNDLDFFSAVDDVKIGAEDAGAGHIGTTEFNSACYYRYIGINLNLLKQSNLFNQEELNVVLENFIRACVIANPTARRNAMFGYTLPTCVLALRRNGQPLSLANAFETPISAGKNGFAAESEKAMLNEWESLKATFGLSEEVKSVVKKDGDTLEAMIAKMLENIAR